MKTLAQAILKAADLHEKSFDKVEADRLPYTQQYPDYEQCYKKALPECCQEASADYSELISILLHNCWNDALSWADDNK